LKAFLEHLSLGSGAGLVAIISILLALAIGFVHSAFVRWSSAIVVPLAVSYCIYWLPVWLGDGGSEYSSWAFLIVTILFIAGVIPFALIIFIRDKLTKRKALQNR